MNQSRSPVSVACWIVLGVCAAGCQGFEAAPPAAPRPSVRVDPCAERLHDICGQLLLYYAGNKRLPRTLAELTTTGSQHVRPLVCPVSGKPYVYNPDGLRLPGRPGRLVLYDAAASHSGMRWGIFVSDPEGDRPFTARVILLPQESLSSADKQPSPPADRRN